MDVRQQAIGPVLAVIESLRSTANMLEAQVQALAPQNSQMGPPMSMFQMYNPSHSIPIAPQLQQQQQQPHSVAPPNSGGSLPGGTTGVIRKRELDGSAGGNGVAAYDDSGAPIKKRRRRRRRNADGILVDRDDVYENGDGVLHPVGRGRGRGSRGGGAGGLRGAHNTDPNRPKRPASAYLLFQNEVRKDMQATFPELPYHEILGKISERWNALSDAEKKHYTDITVVQKAQYEKDKARYEALRGAAAMGVVPPSSAASTATTAPGHNPTVLIGRPNAQISTGLVPVSATSEDAEEDEEEDDEDEASEASAAIQGEPDDEEEEDDEEDEGGGQTA